LEDDADAIAAAIGKAVFAEPASAGKPVRSMQVERYVEMLRKLGPTP